MKVVIEKVPGSEGGVQVSITYDTAKRPWTFTIPQGSAGQVADIIRVAEKSKVFRFEIEMGK